MIEVPSLHRSRWPVYDIKPYYELHPPEQHPLHALAVRLCEADLEDYSRYPDVQKGIIADKIAELQLLRSSFELIA
jgi:hypothetical protein